MQMPSTQMRKHSNRAWKHGTRMQKHSFRRESHSSILVALTVEREVVASSFVLP